MDFNGMATVVRFCVEIITVQKELLSIYIKIYTYFTNLNTGIHSRGRPKKCSRLRPTRTNPNVKIIIYTILSYDSKLRIGIIRSKCNC